MRGLVAILVLALVHDNYATLILRGPTEPVLEGQKVTLECLVTQSDLNSSQVHIERFSKYMASWYSLEPWGGSFTRRCFMFDVEVAREEDRLVVSVEHATSFNAGPFRCVATGTNDTSETLTFAVHYMRKLSVYRPGFSRYLSSVEDLKVPLGANVELECSAASSEDPQYFWQKEGGDWILPLATLTLRDVQAQDGGEYTCTASHPTVASLSKRHTVSITVLPEDAAWYESSNGRLALMTSAAGASLLVLILSMSVFICRRAKKLRTTKGPIDDHSQTKPIYKGSAESLSSTGGDNQPLV
ncbi:vascular endothelial growth factor receptor 2 [Aplochiton taeniatus]